MPLLSENPGTKRVKGLVLGNPGAGKTGALASLVKAGYKLRIYDFDNLMGSLISYVRKDCPEKLSDGSVMVQTFTDKLKGSETPAMMQGKNLYVPQPIDGIPKAYPNALKQFNHWKNESEDLGIPSTWGDNHVVVVDSLTTASRAAYRYCDFMNPGAGDKRAIFYGAQQLIINLLTLLASESFDTNVLVIAHVDYEKDQFEMLRGFPKSIGSAIRTDIAALFNCVLLFENQGQGASAKKVMRTNSTGIIDLKNPVSFKLADSLPIETGLAEFFKAVLNN